MSERQVERGRFAIEMKTILVAGLSSFLVLVSLSSVSALPRNGPHSDSFKSVIGLPPQLPTIDICLC